MSTPGDWRQHLRPSLADLEIYDVPPLVAPARLHANECPQNWAPEVMTELARVLTSLELNRYPDTSGRELRAVLADQYGCTPDRIVLGNGSDEIISTLLLALSGGPEPATLVTPDPTFVMYEHSARVLGLEVRKVALDEQWQLVPGEMRAALADATICFLARPNNPTGTLWDRALIESLIAEFPSTVFVIDEAYVAYAPGESMWRADLPDNVIYMSTLSKVGLAALRLGYGIAHPVLAEAMNKVRHPYNISQTSLALAKAVLTRFRGERAAMIERTIVQRDRLAALLREVDGVRVFESHANLVLARWPSAEAALQRADSLAAAGVRVKTFRGHPRLGDCLRISAGTAEELDRLEAELRGESG